MNSKTLWNDNWYFAKTALGVNWEDRTLWEREMQPADLPHDWLIYDTKNLYRLVSEEIRVFRIRSKACRRSGAGELAGAVKFCGR